MVQPDSNRARSWLADRGVAAVIVAILVIVLAVIIGQLQVVIGWPPLLLALATILLVFGGLSWLTYWYNSRLLQELVTETTTKLERIDRSVQSMGSGISQTWLWPMDAVVQFEATTTSPEIWLISPDLLDDTLNGPFQDVVSRNLARGVNYKYFVPDTDMLRSRARQVQGRHGAHANLQIFFVNDDFFLIAPDFDFVIYDPLDHSRGSRKAHMGLPIAAQFGRYMVEVNPDLIDKIVGHLLPMLDKPTAPSRVPRKG